MIYILGTYGLIGRPVHEYLNGRVGDERVQVYKVRCYETPTSVAIYQIS
jgi:hypothetical protein